MTEDVDGILPFQLGGAGILLSSGGKLSRLRYTHS